MRGRKNRFDQRAIDCARCVTISVERAGGSMALVRRGIHVATRVASDDVASDDVGPSRERPSGCRFLRRVHRSHRRHPARKAKPFWTACSSLHVTGLFSQTGTARRRRAWGSQPSRPGALPPLPLQGAGEEGPGAGGPAARAARPLGRGEVRRSTTPAAAGRGGPVSAAGPGPWRRGPFHGSDGGRPAARAGPGRGPGPG